MHRNAIIVKSLAVRKSQKCWLNWCAICSLRFRKNNFQFKEQSFALKLLTVAVHRVSNATNETWVLWKIIMCKWNISQLGLVVTNPERVFWKKLTLTMETNIYVMQTLCFGLSVSQWVQKSKRWGFLKKNVVPEKNRFWFSKNPHKSTG